MATHPQSRFDGPGLSRTVCTVYPSPSLPPVLLLVGQRTPPPPHFLPYAGLKVNPAPLPHPSLTHSPAVSLSLSLSVSLSVSVSISASLFLPLFSTQGKGIELIRSMAEFCQKFSEPMSSNAAGGDPFASTALPSHGTAVSGGGGDAESAAIRHALANPTRSAMASSLPKKKAALPHKRLHQYTYVMQRYVLNL